MGKSTTVDQGRSLVKLGGGDRHSQSQTVVLGLLNHCIEVGIWGSCCAALGAMSFVEAKAKGASNRHAVHSVGLGPG